MSPFVAQIVQRYLMWCLLLTQIGLVFVIKVLRWKRLLYDHLIFVMHFVSFAYFSDMIFRTIGILSLVGGVPLTLIQSAYCAFAFRRVYAMQWRPRIRFIPYVLDLVEGLVVFAAMTVLLQALYRIASIYYVMPAAS